MVFELIRHYGLAPSRFEWEVAEGAWENITVPMLAYVDSDYFYAFDVDRRSQHGARWSPGKEVAVERALLGSWEEQLKQFALWLDRLKRELNEPDLWESLTRYSTLSAEMVDPSEQNRQFTVPEVEQIAVGLENARAFLLAEFAGLEQQLKAVNEGIDYLKDACRRQGRRDWFQGCLGWIVTLGIAVSLAPEQALKTWAFIKQQLAGVIHLLPRPQQP